MDSVSDDNESKPTVRFTDRISLRDILSEDGAVFEIKYDDFLAADNKENLLNDEDLYNNFDCLGIEDEDTYNDTEPFEQLSKKMIDLTPDGKVKKRVLREGVGNSLPENGHVTCDYNAYLEYSPTPFDSTYARNRPFKLRLDEGQTLPGLEIAIKSMKVMEKSQFLIHPDLAYGKMGCLSRVPPDTQVLFEVEVKNCLHTGPIQSYQNLPKEEQQDFKNVQEFVKALHQKGNVFYKQNLIKQAIKEYNVAVTKLEDCTLADYREQEVQQELLLTLYSNLVNAYTKIQVPRKACIIANQIFRLVKGTSLRVPAKVYFHNARALMMLGDYASAKQKLQMANRLCPNDEDVAKEFVKLEELIKANYQREIKLARAIFKNVDKDKKDVPNMVTEEFKDTLKEYFMELVADESNTQYNLPDDLNDIELNYIRTNAPQFNLIFGEKDGKYFVYKQPSLD
ncbi:inactive peptidyl-prolyl cis-trans isomerase fkbp6 [Holotrichia oblita]|uniref:Inactive peptidyl-prolyl cis-trans isomerase fkbp6 n=1 Tax=Holotrichia oblita TaxID=644536 RepID=A0ACB9TTA9_HOLOL|nr:inactive peptidyl-prolyl cis-trans isomerase fkbp6 [Holotrichia oblita]